MTVLAAAFALTSVKGCHSRKSQFLGVRHCTLRPVRCASAGENRSFVAATMPLANSLGFVSYSRMKLQSHALPLSHALSIVLSKIPSTAGPWVTSATLLSAAALGLALESTAIGAALSAPLVTMFTTLVLSNLGLLPASSPLYSAVTSYLVTIAVPLLLYGADLKRVVRQTGALLRAFVVGMVGTVFGTVVAWKLVPIAQSIEPADAWKIAAALCARHIGGSVNYVAVVEATGATAESVAAGLAADNLIVAMYFLLLFYIARQVVYEPDKSLASNAPLPSPGSGQMKFNVDDKGEDVTYESSVIGLVDMAIAVSLSSVLCALGTALSEVFLPQLGAIPVITFLVVALASLIPRQIRPLCKAGNVVGIWMMQIFFAATGASGSLVNVLHKAPALFAFSTIQLAIHLLTVLVIGKLLRCKLQDLLIASNANVGGPTTAAGMAAAKRWKELVVPALLVGVAGYATATFISLGVGHLLLKPGLKPARPHFPPSS